MFFYQSKVKLENVIVCEANKVQVKAVILRPSWMLGPNEDICDFVSAISSTGREPVAIVPLSSIGSKSTSCALLSQLLVNGSVQEKSWGGGFSIVDVRDVATSFVKAMQVNGFAF